MSVICFSYLKVEKIVGMRKATNGREFLVRWQGFEPADDTWEREEFLNCGNLISDFLKNRKVRKEKLLVFMYYYLSFH